MDLTNLEPDKIQNALLRTFMIEVQATKAPHTVRWFMISLTTFDRWLADNMVQKFDRDCAFQYMEWLKRKGKGKASVWLSEKAIKAFYEFLCKIGVFTENPMRSPINRYTSPKRMDDFAMTHREYVKIIEHPSIRADWRGATVIAWHTGMRLGDICCLEWSMVEPERILLIPRKTSRLAKRIEIPVLPELRDCIKLLDRSDRIYVFPRLQSLYRRDPSQLSREFRFLLRRVKIKGKSFHSFRHAFVTRALSNGMPMAILSEITGQSMNVICSYMHPTLEQKTEAMRRYA